MYVEDLGNNEWISIYVPTEVHTYVTKDKKI